MFAGDFRQLEPVDKKYNKPLYMDDTPEFNDWVNCYIELNGLHRFKDDPAWGRLLMRFRNGLVTAEDIDAINKRIFAAGDVLPENIRYATMRNADRDAINAALFEEHCERQFKKHGHTNNAVVIFADKLKVQNRNETYVCMKNTILFYENVGEDDVKFSKKSTKRLDPVLKLYKGLRVMLVDNVDVLRGQANGSQAIVIRIVLKRNETPATILLGGSTPVRAVVASQVDHVVLKHCNDKVQPATFKVQASEHAFSARFPKVNGASKRAKEEVKMKARQFLFVVNNATTGHKLQGASVDNLFVHSWYYMTNWVYVVLSRVRTKAGLFARNKLSYDLTKYAVPQQLTDLMSRFRQ